MAERYHPKARERQRQLIQKYLEQDPQELFQELDEYVNTSGSAIVWAIDLILWLYQKLNGSKYPPLHLGRYSWRFYMQMHRLQHKVCKEWHFCEKVHNSKKSDRVELADELTYFLVEKGFHHTFAVGIAAVALLSIDPAELCGCEDE